MGYELSSDDPATWWTYVKQSDDRPLTWDDSNKASPTILRVPGRSKTHTKVAHTKTRGICWSIRFRFPDATPSFWRHGREGQRAVLQTKIAYLHPSSRTSTRPSNFIRSNKDCQKCQPRRQGSPLSNRNGRYSNTSTNHHTSKVNQDPLPGARHQWRLGTLR
jgi:hypothetical protein